MQCPRVAEELPGEITCLPDYPPKTMVPLKKQIAEAAKLSDDVVLDTAESGPIAEYPDDVDPDTVVELKEGYHY